VAEDVLLSVPGVPLEALDGGEERSEIEHEGGIC
jgi:hypothetical protein